MQAEGRIDAMVTAAEPPQVLVARPLTPLAENAPPTRPPCRPQAERSLARRGRGRSFGAASAFSPARRRHDARHLARVRRSRRWLADAAHRGRRPPDKQRETARRGRGQDQLLTVARLALQAHRRPGGRWQPALRRARALGRLGASAHERYLKRYVIRPLVRS